MRYRVLYDTKLHKLVEEVESLIDDGFEVVEGMKPFMKDGDIIFFQTMVKGIEEL